MPKYTHEQLSSMSNPVSTTEAEKIQHAIDALKNAMRGCENSSSDQYIIFPQGSYANNTNVRTESDVDLNICYTAAFYYKLPEGSTKEQFGFNNPSDYSSQQFKNDVEKALVAYFGRANVTRKNKCLHVKSNTYRVEMDVVPTWRYHRYSNRFARVTGVKQIADDGTEVINFPEQHIENGKRKNDNTKRRYKSLTRIVKKLNIKMEEDGYYTNNNVSSFLLECLAYNLPDSKYMLYSDLDWNEILKQFIYYCWDATRPEKEDWKQWTEVSGLLWLMYGHKWAREDVHEFMCNLWNYLEYE